MNQAERTLAQALTQCRTKPLVHASLKNDWDRQFIQSLAWLAKHEPEGTLSGRQRYNLHLMAYRYRRQLAGVLDEDLIPVDPPDEKDYVRPAPPQLQTDLLDGSARAMEFDEPLELTVPSRQKGLF